jgi:hypothetical protein
MPLDPCLGISIGDLLLPMGSLETGTAGEAGSNVQGSCSSAPSIQALLVQDSAGGGLVVDAHGAQVDGGRTVQATPVEEGGSNGGDQMRVDGKGDKAGDHAKEVGASVQGMQIVVDLVEKSSEGMS